MDQNRRMNFRVYGFLTVNQEAIPPFEFDVSAQKSNHKQKEKD